MACFVVEVLTCDARKKKRTERVHPGVPRTNALPSPAGRASPRSRSSGGLPEVGPIVVVQAGTICPEVAVEDDAAASLGVYETRMAAVQAMFVGAGGVVVLDRDDELVVFRRQRRRAGAGR